MTEKLIHFSHEPLVSIKNKRQFLNQYEMKPQGLWVSVGGDWKTWCEDNSFNLNCFNYQTEIVLKDDAAILTLASPSDIDGFTRQYRHNKWAIKWWEVAKKFSGIVIAPYCWECRLTPETSWYYTWDCASGCIWDNQAVKELVALEACPI